MSSFVRALILVATLLGIGSRASPAIRSSDIEVFPVLQERIPSITLGSFDLSTSLVNDVLFDYTQTYAIDANGGATVGFKITCISCTTSGSAIVSTTDVLEDSSAINDIISFFEDPLGLITSAFGLNVKVSFSHVSGHFDIGIEATGAVTYSFPIFSSTTPVGAAVSDEISFGMVLFIDLVVSLDAEVDLETGFDFAFPDGAYITVDPLAGEIVDQGFTGGEADALPITVTSGSATFQAALRVRVQAGTTVILFGTGFDFELGIFADLIEYQTTITSTPACELSITESLDVNIGAFAHAVAEINYSTFGANPAVVTTILEIPLPSLCLTRPATTATALPTDSIISLVSTQSTIPLPSVTPALATASLAARIILTPTNSSSRWNTTQAPSTTSSSTMITAPPLIPSGSLYKLQHANGTITPAPALTTSTVFVTDIATFTSCSSNVLHCPASLTKEVIVTSTKILYTTVCPVGATLPTTLPTSLPLPVQSSSLSRNASHFSTSRTAMSFTTTLSHTTASSLGSISLVSTSTIAAAPLISPLHFTPCQEPIIETIYTPTFTNPVYTMPTATVFPVPFPHWNETLTFTPLTISTATASPTSAASSKPSTVGEVKAVVSSSEASYAAKPTLGFVGLEKAVNESSCASGSGSGSACGSAIASISALRTLPSGTATSVPFTGGASRMVLGQGGIIAAGLFLVTIMLL